MKYINPAQSSTFLGGPAVTNILLVATVIAVTWMIFSKK
jgi:hypothetical protein